MSVVIARPKRLCPIFICAKCVRRAPDGKTIRKELTAAIRRSDWAVRRPPKLVETKCLGICPKKAVVVASGPTLAAGTMLVVREGDFGCAAIRILAGDANASKPT